ncbi:dipeptidyl-peptidase 3 family protein [Luteithermobacter gelatinilyticus]|mgnify:CR=1 FL=1|uniref:dipeptidyl-peptidase 3 family protein n=1 Tax=Luteithermobacter gelatinilyticus TaxID=2582913 RepID=UPI0011070813|nr:Zn-dependent hydrolase [Luteithermobacter gelatinilyticus]|tara:strand:+ start:15857 stop:17551 length:1695 start_codon:yes stop_codon:yes gene_type:complete
MSTSVKHLLASVSLASCLFLAGCGQNDTTSQNSSTDAPQEKHQLEWVSAEAEKRADIYAPYTLQADLSHLSDNQRKMIGLLIEASQIMDNLFWLQAYGDKNKLLDGLEDGKLKHFIELNYGPWDRLDGDKPFIKGVKDKPLGARFYPEDMTKEEFEAFEHTDKRGLYSLVRREEDGSLKLVPYHDAFAADLQKAAGLLREAAKYADHDRFREYLKLRADALETDNYQPSDMAWMDMKTNPIELVIGAIETYEDQLYGYRAAYESYVLIKDMAWSERLSKYAAFLPELQKGLPVPAEYKAEMPGTESDLNAYDVVYYAGHSNAGSKTIAINLPNDEEVQLKKGTRRLQLKNAMKAKFDKIMLPIADELIVPEQRQHVTFPAFFANTMFHEVAHGLGIKNTLTGKGTVRTALKETASALEEGKADILGLYMVTRLHEKGELEDGELMDYYTTFLAGIFRSVRFGASSAHGRANMVRFNYFKEMGAFERNQEGQYKVNFENFQKAMTNLSTLILTLQGNGDYEGAKALLAEKGVVGDDLAEDLNRLAQSNIPVDVYFIQGKDVLGLQ